MFLFGEKRFGPKVHFWSAVLVFLGSWISGFFIVATDAWMQHPVAYAIGADGSAHLTSFWGLMTNSWVFWQYLHTMAGAVVTAAFVMAAVGAYYLLLKRHTEHAKAFLRVGIIAGLIAVLFQVFPSGDSQGAMIANYQPATMAAMRDCSRRNRARRLSYHRAARIPKPERLIIPIIVPSALSFLTYRSWTATVRGHAFPGNNVSEHSPAVSKLLIIFMVDRNHIVAIL